jgi:hypothetical protein
MADDEGRALRADASGVAQVLEQRILQPLEEAATRFRQRYPESARGPGRWALVPSTRGMMLGIDCLNPGASDDQPDNVALSIGVKHLTTLPLLCTADVCWGDGKPRGGGLDVLPEPVVWSAAAIEAVEARLPALLASLEEELQRLDSNG